MKDQQHVAVIGGANVDVHGMPRLPLRRSDSNPGRVRWSSGGVARNIAENLSRLGLDARLISAVGDDDSGRFLLRQCREAGIGIEGVHRHDSLPTAVYLSVLNADGDLDVAVSDMRVVDELSPVEIEAHVPVLEAARLIVVDCNLSASALDWLFARFPRQTFYVDTVSQTKAAAIRPHLESVHTLKASRAEAESLSGLPAKSEHELVRMSDWLHDSGVSRVFVTLGSAGIFFSDGETSGVRPNVFRGASIRNTGGAGDAFLSGIVRASIDELTMPQIVDLGFAAANLTLSDWRACSPDLSMEEILRAMGERSGH